MDVNHVGTVFRKVGNEYRTLNIIIRITSIFLKDKIFIQELY